MTAAVPEDLRYTDEHEWVRVGADDITVGITDYAQQQLGDVVFVDLPEPGTQIERGQTFGEIESTKSVSDLYAPVSGTIAARNESLEAQPEIVNSAPFTEGWLVTITPSAPEQLESLLLPDAYRQLTGQ